jgi:DNA-binding MarR family transcriptional regulator
MSTELHDRLVREAPDRLARLIAHGEILIPTILSEKKGSRSCPDRVLKFGQSIFVVECKTSSDAATIAATIRNVKEQAGQIGKKAIPTIAVPFMGPVGRRLCEEAGVSWFDLTGNARLEAPGVRVHIEGKPNRFLRPVRPRSIFAPKSARLIRWLLIHPEERFTQRNLVQDTGLSKGLVSRLVRRLGEQGLVERGENDAIRLRDYNAMLDAWREVYDFSKHTIIRGHVAARSSDEIVRKLADQFDSAKLQHAVTGLAGAWLWTQFAGFRLVVFYVERSPGEDVREAIGFHEEKSGENVWLVVPNDVGVFHGASQRDGVMCAHPVQVYLDLKNQPERSAEAAERLRKELLVRKING